MRKIFALLAILWKGEKRITTITLMKFIFYKLAWVKNLKKYGK
jgi:heme/copper-type cytochrome/quinol oxidase subunit 1